MTFIRRVLPCLVAMALLTACSLSQPWQNDFGKFVTAFTEEAVAKQAGGEAFEDKPVTWRLKYKGLSGKNLFGGDELLLDPGIVGLEGRLLITFIAGKDSTASWGRITPDSLVTVKGKLFIPPVTMSVGYGPTESEASRMRNQVRMVIVREATPAER